MSNLDRFQELEDSFYAELTGDKEALKKQQRLIEIYKTLNTGDIILFHEKQSWLSWFIELFGKSKFSHVAMILRDPTYINPKLTGLYILESGFETFPESETNTVKFGVQIVPFNKVFQEYTGDIYVRRLTCNRDLEFYSNLRKVHSQVHGKPYDLRPKDWFHALEKELGKSVPTGRQMNTFWCSSLMAYVFVGLKFLPENFNWSFVRPKEWSGAGKTDLVFENCTLKVEEKINNFS
jgi:hypothetical protein